ncbi:substrate-binding domain-containing protein [Roseococcus pinisoli]|uniref:Substrate-binding domain-containing protein n=1 Tax=Roseococcus pinisoli TaxID=2835040 RepID=A0ABS5QJJ3_9PROT|nr:substrate-binding domain-containing protein [Roseococcus pinisoli]MBS7813097.1 substrate-binding domain-containing protein [Roseococcus pinisoli]
MDRRTLLLAAGIIASAQAASAAEPLNVYGPGGPLPAMREAAAAFGRAEGLEVRVTAGPTPAWIERARADADLVFSGSEVMMSDFIAALPEIDPASVVPLYLRPSAILVRPGNPGRIGGVADLLRPGHRILVVNGAGQQGLWEDVAGRLGDIASVRAFRANIAVFARNSAEARDAWVRDPSLDAWLIWNIWQVSNPSLAETVPIEPEYRIHRDTGIALTRRGAARPEAKRFAEFLAGPEGARIFARWGWMTGPSP